MESFERSLHEVIRVIDHFLDETKDPSIVLAADIFQEVSSRIESARRAREFREPGTVRETYAGLCRAYHGKLECLLRRLGDLEIRFTQERNRLAEQHNWILRTRDWHQAMSNTQ